jgi:hypothetical protein
MTRTLATSRRASFARRFVLPLACVLALAASFATPISAFAEKICTSTVTRYYLFGYEVYRSETMTCQDVPSLA